MTAKNQYKPTFEKIDTESTNRFRVIPLVINVSNVLCYTIDDKVNLQNKIAHNIANTNVFYQKPGCTIKTNSINC